MTQQIATRTQGQIETLTERKELAQALIKTLNLKNETADSVLIKIQAGAELGLTPMRAVAGNTFAVINGKLTVMGDAARALVRASGALEPGTDITVRYEGTGDEIACVVTSHRRETPGPVEHRFSVQDAKRAKLWGKAGPWQDHPKRMLMYRALGHHCRDEYSDVLLGLYVAEEADEVDEPAPRAGTVSVAALGPASGHQELDPLFAEAEEGAPAVDPTPAQEESPAATEEGEGARLITGKARTIRGAITKQYPRAKDGRPYWVYDGQSDSGLFQVFSDDPLVAQVANHHIDTGQELVLEIEETGKMPRLLGVSVEADLPL